MENSINQKNDDSQLGNNNLCSSSFPNDIRKSKEDITLIWLNETGNDSIYCKEILNKFRELNDYVQLYSDSQSCIEYIKSVTEEKILLIIFNGIPSNILAQIYSLQAVASIFIYSRDNYQYNIDFNQYPKNIKIFNDQNSLIESTRIYVRGISKGTTTFTLFNNDKQNFIRELTHAASFLWFHVLVDVLKGLPQADQAKQQMIDICTNYYETNHPILVKIKTFEDTYQPSDAIRWYTANSFIYNLLNKALRTEDVELLYFFRFYMIDLYQQIEQEGRRYLSSLTLITLYRGQMMIKKDLEQLKKDIGNLISPNGFFSTTKDLDVALIYSGEDDDELKSVLFEITIDRTKIKNASKIVVADIENFSHFPDEKEVLFGIGTIFKIENIIEDPVLKKWRIKMTVSDEGLDYVQQYLESIRKDLEDTNSTRLFGKLLVELGQYLKAESYFNLVLKTLPANHEDFPSLYHGLGYIRYKRGDYKEAIQYDRIAYEIRKKTLPENHLDIAKSCINLGSDYRQNGNNITAMELFKEALIIEEQKYSGRDHYNIATTLTSIGVTYACLNDYQNAHDYLTRALEMYQRVLPSDHPAIASALVKFGDLFEKKAEYNQALQYYQRAFDMAEKTLPIEHPRLLEYFRHIIKIYKTMNRIDDAIQFFDEKVAHYRQLLGETHPNVAQFFKIIKDLCDGNEHHLPKC